MPKRRVFNSSLAWLAAARTTEKLRNSGGVAHIADFVRNGMLPCVTLGTMTVASGEITGRDCLKRGRAAMAEFDDELDMQRELDTRDSLASMAHYHVSSPGYRAGVAAKLHSHCDRPHSPCDGHDSRNTVGCSGKTGADWPFRSIHTFAGCRLAS